MDKEYILVFERNDGATAVTRASGTFEQVSEFVSKIMGADPDTVRCYISETIKIVEVQPVEQKEDLPDAGSEVQEG